MTEQIPTPEKKPSALKRAALKLGQIAGLAALLHAREAKSDTLTDEQRARIEEIKKANPGLQAMFDTATEVGQPDEKDETKVAESSKTSHESPKK